MDKGLLEKSRSYEEYLALKIEAARAAKKDYKRKRREAFLALGLTSKGNVRKGPTTSNAVQLHPHGLIAETLRLGRSNSGEKGRRGDAVHVGRVAAQKSFIRIEQCPVESGDDENDGHVPFQEDVSADQLVADGEQSVVEGGTVWTLSSSNSSSTSINTSSSSRSSDDDDDDDDGGSSNSGLPVRGQKSPAADAGTAKRKEKENFGKGRDNKLDDNHDGKKAPAPLFRIQKTHESVKYTLLVPSYVANLRSDKKRSVLMRIIRCYRRELKSSTSDNANKEDRRGVGCNEDAFTYTDRALVGDRGFYAATKGKPAAIWRGTFDFGECCVLGAEVNTSNKACAGLNMGGGLCGVDENKKSSTVRVAATRKHHDPAQPRSTRVNNSNDKIDESQSLNQSEDNTCRGDEGDFSPLLATLSSTLLRLTETAAAMADKDNSDGQNKKDDEADETSEYLPGRGRGQRGSSLREGEGARMAAWGQKGSKSAQILRPNRVHFSPETASEALKRKVREGLLRSKHFTGQELRKVEAAGRELLQGGVSGTAADSGTNKDNPFRYNVGENVQKQLQNIGEEQRLSQSNGGSLNTSVLGTRVDVCRKGGEEIGSEIQSKGSRGGFGERGRGGEGEEKRHEKQHEHEEASDLQKRKQETQWQQQNTSRRLTLSKDDTPLMNSTTLCIVEDDYDDGELPSPASRMSSINTCTTSGSTRATVAIPVEVDYRKLQALRGRQPVEDSRSFDGAVHGRTIVAVSEEEEEEEEEGGRTSTVAELLSLIEEDIPSAPPTPPPLPTSAPPPSSSLAPIISSIEARRVTSDMSLLTSIGRDATAGKGDELTSTLTPPSQRFEAPTQRDDPLHYYNNSGGDGDDIDDLLLHHVTHSDENGNKGSNSELVASTATTATNATISNETISIGGEDNAHPQKSKGDGNDSAAAGGGGTELQHPRQKKKESSWFVDSSSFSSSQRDTDAATDEETDDYGNDSFFVSSPSAPSTSSSRSSSSSTLNSGSTSTSTISRRRSSSNSSRASRGHSGKAVCTNVKRESCITPATKLACGPAVTTTVTTLTPGLRRRWQPKSAPTVVVKYLDVDLSEWGCEPLLPPFPNEEKVKETEENIRTSSKKYHVQHLPYGYLKARSAYRRVIGDECCFFDYDTYKVLVGTIIGAELDVRRSSALHVPSEDDANLQGKGRRRNTDARRSSSATDQQSQRQQYAALQLRYNITVSSDQHVDPSSSSSSASSQEFKVTTHHTCRRVSRGSRAPKRPRDDRQCGERRGGADEERDLLFGSSLGSSSNVKTDKKEGGTNNWRKKKGRDTAPSSVGAGASDSCPDFAYSRPYGVIPTGTCVGASIWVSADRLFKVPLPLPGSSSASSSSSSSPNVRRTSAVHSIDALKRDVRAFVRRAIARDPSLRYLDTQEEAAALSSNDSTNYSSYTSSSMSNSTKNDSSDHGSGRDEDNSCIERSNNSEEVRGTHSRRGGDGRGEDGGKAIDNKEEEEEKEYRERGKGKEDTGNTDTQKLTTNDPAMNMSIGEEQQRRRYYGHRSEPLSAVGERGTCGKTSRRSLYLGTLRDMTNNQQQQQQQHQNASQPTPTYTRFTSNGGHEQYLTNRKRSVITANKTTPRPTSNTRDNSRSGDGVGKWQMTVYLDLNLADWGLEHLVDEETTSRILAAPCVRSLSCTPSTNKAVAVASQPQPGGVLSSSSSPSIGLAQLKKRFVGDACCFFDYDSYRVVRGTIVSASLKKRQRPKHTNANNSNTNSSTSSCGVHALQNGAEKRDMVSMEALSEGKATEVRNRTSARIIDHDDNDDDNNAANMSVGVTPRAHVQVDCSFCVVIDPSDVEAMVHFSRRVERRREKLVSESQNNNKHTHHHDDNRGNAKAATTREILAATFGKPRWVPFNNVFKVPCDDDDDDSNSSDDDPSFSSRSVSSASSSSSSSSLSEVSVGLKADNSTLANNMMKTTRASSTTQSRRRHRVIPRGLGILYGLEDSSATSASSPSSSSEAEREAKDEDKENGLEKETRKKEGDGTAAAKDALINPFRSPSALTEGVDHSIDEKTRRTNAAMRRVKAIVRKFVRRQVAANPSLAPTWEMRARTKPRKRAREEEEEDEEGV